MTQKILAAHAGLECVEAGQLIEATLDMVLGNDVTAPVAIKEMEKMKAEGVFDKDKIALVPDHFTPNKDIKSAENCMCKTKSHIILKSGKWGLNMRFCRNRVWWQQGMP